MKEIKFNLSHYSQNEQNWIKVLNKLNKEMDADYKPRQKSEVQDLNNTVQYYELRQKPYLRKEILDIEFKLIMKHTLTSSPSFIRMKDKNDMIQSLEQLMIFLTEQLDEKIEKNESDYYHYMDHLDVLKGMLEYAYLLENNDTFVNMENKAWGSSIIVSKYEIDDKVVPSVEQLEIIKEDE